MVWYSHLFQNFPQFLVIYTVKGFGIVNKAEIDVFLELSCFFHDPVDVGNLIAGSSAFSPQLSPNSANHFFPLLFEFYLFLFSFLALLCLHCGFSLVALGEGVAPLHCSVALLHLLASHCSGCSCRRARALGAWASVVAAQGFSGCGARA